MSLNTDYAFIPSLMFYPWHVAKFGVKIDGANPPEGSASFTDKYKYVHTHTPQTRTHTQREISAYICNCGRLHILISHAMRSFSRSYAFV